MMILMREKRKKQNLTQKQLANIIGVDRSTITKIENGSRPSVVNAKKIAQVLGFSWVEFFKDENKKNKNIEQSA
ncbi:helix-turn-helix transcriptional regulator [Thermoanaerobacterium thermosaccharolyticum]|uniref:helix-turn-helix transcriptional regulator n=1 Tax=Thermoanaerobacterium thermosaccharolyticum TaxID=1517 RepID=UPI003D2AD3A2